MSKIVKKNVNSHFLQQKDQNFGNSHAFFTLTTKKVLIFLGIPNEKRG